jgi:hypothetical protein
VIDDKGKKWVGTEGGLVTIDGDTWNVFKSTNSGLPYNNIFAISIDNQNIKWIGTSGGGLARFNDVEWKVFNASNSPLPVDDIRAFAIDGDGNKWIGTYFGGLAVYKESTVGIVESSANISCILEQNHPNPFTSTTTISWHSAKSRWQTLKVFDVYGNEVATLVDEFRPAGNHSVDFSAKSLPVGVYFYHFQADGVSETKKMIVLK